MSPLYHLQVGAFLANARPYTLRERRLIMLASLAPDLDGVFFFDADLWGRFHHTFSHNLFSMLFISLAFALYNRGRRLELFALCAASSMLQILIDVITNDPSWSQQFLRPLTDYNFTPAEFTDWSYLGAFQVYWVQGSLMVLILAGTVILYTKTGRTFLELASTRLDRFLTDFIVLSFTARCAVCQARARFRESATGVALCANHAEIRRDLSVGRKNDPGRKGSNLD